LAREAPCSGDKKELLIVKLAVCNPRAAGLTTSFNKPGLCRAKNKLPAVEQSGAYAAYNQKTSRTAFTIPAFSVQPD